VLAGELQSHLDQEGQAGEPGQSELDPLGAVLRRQRCRWVGDVDHPRLVAGVGHGLD
jgi:hypothetical protein